MPTLNAPLEACDEN